MTLGAIDEARLQGFAGLAFPISFAIVAVNFGIFELRFSTVPGRAAEVLF
jgi:hypothetical protein